METIILIGIQATGKSTFYKQKFFRSHMHISLDVLRTRTREDIFIDACIRAKQPFVVDNTNPSVQDRKKYIEISKAAGFRVVGYYFHSDIKDAMEWNERRTGKEFIPAKGIASVYNRLVMPSYDEGFDELYYVNIGEDNYFIIRDWKDLNSII